MNGLKIIVLATVCERYKDRILNLIKNFDFFQKDLQTKNITPLFVYGKQNLSIDIPYPTIQVDVEEKYTTLYQKIYKGLKHIHQKLDYDYVIKIDDDTLVNFNLLDKPLFEADYTGRMHGNFSINTIDINLPMYNIRHTIDLYPSKVFKTEFSFATGDFYILSKKAVNLILEKEAKLSSFLESDYICEDQMIGYFLKDGDLNRKNISLMTEEIEKNILQITSNLVSLHPVNSVLFQSLIGLDPQHQLFKLLEAKRTNLWYRKTLVQSLESELKEVLLRFANSPKKMGMG